MDCPACGGPVTLEVGPDQPLSISLSAAILAAAEDERVVVARNCWDCGWREARHLRVESINVTDGDEVVIERATLREEITDELAAIDSPATLEAVLAEVRRQRRGELSTADAVDDDTE